MFVFLEVSVSRYVLVRTIGKNNRIFSEYTRLPLVLIWLQKSSDLKENCQKEKQIKLILRVRITLSDFSDNLQWPPFPCYQIGFLEYMAILMSTGVVCGQLVSFR